MPRLKGQVFLAVTEHVALEYGPAGYDLLRNTLSPAERAEIDAIGWGAWRPFDLWLSLARAAAILFARSGQPDGQLAFIERAGAFGAERDLTVMRRMLLRIASPALLIERAAILWSQFVDSGTLSARMVSERRAEAAIAEWPHPEPLFCAMMQGWMRRYLEMCGAHEVALVHSECRGRRDASCRWTARWRAK
jgi:hypothetical protein